MSVEVLKNFLVFNHCRIWCESKIGMGFLFCFVFLNAPKREITLGELELEFIAVRFKLLDMPEVDN